MLPLLKHTSKATAIRHTPNVQQQWSVLTRIAAQASTQVGQLPPLPLLWQTQQEPLRQPIDAPRSHSTSARCLARPQWRFLPAKVCVVAAGGVGQQYWVWQRGCSSWACAANTPGNPHIDEPNGNAHGQTECHTRVIVTQRLFKDLSGIYTCTNEASYHVICLASYCSGSATVQTHGVA